jgi:hypothetical protein
MRQTSAHLCSKFVTVCVVLFSCLSLTLYCSFGDTPLNRAIEEDKPDIVALLRGVGASK